MVADHNERVDSKLTVSVPQLAGLFRFAHNPAQSGFESHNAFLKKSYALSLSEQKMRRMALLCFCGGRGNFGCYTTSIPCQDFYKILGKVFESHVTVSQTVTSPSAQENNRP